MMSKLSKTLTIVIVSTVIVIIVVIFTFNLGVNIENQIFTALNLILIFAYVTTTYYLVKTNEKLVASYEKSLCLQNTPVITAEIYTQLSALKVKRNVTQEEIDDIENINTAKLIIINHSMNNATDVRINITAHVEGRLINSSPPLDGTSDWCLQAKNNVIRVIKIQENYLNVANTTIRAMIGRSNESNRHTQLVLKVKIDYSDGCGHPVDPLNLSWSLNFKEKVWEYNLPTA